MGRVRDLATAHGEALGSSFIHWMPPLQGLAAKYLLKLTGPNDRILRWRVAKGGLEADANWVEVRGPESASDFNPENWESVVLGTAKSNMSELRRGEELAVAYLGYSVGMVGVREIKPSGEFFASLDAQGRPDPEGDMIGVVMRAGEHLRAAIGGAKEGRYFRPFETHILCGVVEVPDGLYRV